MPEISAALTLALVSWLLAIESSTARGSLALLCDGEPAFVGCFEGSRNHNALLFAPLQEALETLGEDRLDLVLIGTGPGSYSGIRVGIAAAQGVSLAHACPAAGLPSLLASPVHDGVAVGDARRGGLWWARLGEGLPQTAVIDPAEFPALIRPGEVLFTHETGPVPGLPAALEIRREFPTATRLAHAWQALPEGTREELRTQPPQPVYTRPPHVTAAKPGHPLLRPR